MCPFFCGECKEIEAISQETDSLGKQFKHECVKFSIQLSVIVCELDFKY